MSWPKSLFGFLCKMLGKNLNKPFGSPNTPSTFLVTPMLVRDE